MNAAAAFAHREEDLLERLAQAQDMERAISACAMALEQTACELAQDEQDELARQRQQAVMALARRAPGLLRAATARGELVLSGEAKARPQGGLRGYARAAGAFLLAALAVYEIIDGQMGFALVQLAGGVLLLFGGGREAGAGMQARGVAGVDAAALVRALRALCEAADVCVDDLGLLDRQAGLWHAGGAPDEAMLDVMGALMEAKASGREDFVLRSLDQAQQYLRMQGIDVVEYDAAHAQWFDILPTMGEARTIRPAMVREGKVLRRGVAALRAERSVSA